MKVQMKFYPTTLRRDVLRDYTAVDGQFSPIGTKFCGDAPWTGPGSFSLPPNMARTMMEAREWTVTIEAEAPGVTRDRLARDVATNATGEQLDAIAKIMAGD